MIILLSGLFALFVVALTATALLCALSVGGFVFLWQRHIKALSRIEDLTGTVYTLYSEKAVLQERQKTVMFGKQSSVIH